jgi:predicted dehydrogenase
VASNEKHQEGLTRRDFTTRVGAAAAGLAVGGEFFRVSAQGSGVRGRVLGANDRVITASIGVRGQGNSLKQGFARLPNVQIKTLCDIDANLEASRVNDKELADVPTFKPGFVQDLRRVLDDKDVDAVVIATPNHWHALATIWALQAGKHVYVEKPASHTIWEGRRMVEAATRYGKVVQVGTMNRSRPAVRAAIKYIQDGGLGKVYMARGLCFKPRAGIGKYPDGPMAPGETYKLNSIAASFEPPYDTAYLSKVDYNWHWHWEYGNGDTGNQGPHQFDIARWGLGKQEHPIKVVSTGGYFGPESSQETPDTQTALYEYADGTLLEFGTRGEHTNDEGGVRIGVIFYGAKGWLWIDETGRNWQSYQGPVGEKNEKGPGSGTTGGEVGLTTSEGNHMQNFVDAVRANDPKLLTCDILEGHLSAALPHLANISYRVGHQLRFDPKNERFEDDKKADALLNRDGGYRKGFEIPKSFT